MNTEKNIRDLILDKLRESGAAAAVFTTNGYKMNGKVVAFDRYVVVLEDYGKQMVVYKHAISTIVLECPVELMS